MFMDSTDCDIWRIVRRWIDTELDFIKAEVQILRLKASFLKVLLSCNGKLHIRNGNLEHLLTGILVGFQNADLNLQRLWLDFFIRTSSEKSWFMPITIDGLLSGMLEKLELLRPDIQEVYTILSNSSGLDTDKIHEATRVGYLEKELERISLKLLCFEKFSRFRGMFTALRRRLLFSSEELEIPTCFNDIKAVFSSGGLLSSHDMWLLNRIKANRTDNAVPFEVEARKIVEQRTTHGLEDKLKMIETKKLMSPIRNEVQALRLKVSFLRVFPGSKGKWHTEDGNLKALLTHIHSVSQSLDAPLSDMREELHLLKPDIQQVYAILSKSSLVLISVTSANGVMRKLNSLQENMEDLLRCNAELVAPVNEELETVRKSLRFLTSFLCFITKRCSKPEELRDLLIHAEFPIVKISCLLYLCSVDDDKMMSDQVVNDMKIELSSELQKFSLAQPDVREIYIKALQASKSDQENSTLVDEFDLYFLDSLRDYVLELSNTELNFMTCDKNEILSLHEELRILTISLAMDKPPEDETHNKILERINAVIITTGSAIYYSFHNDEKNGDEGRGLSIAVVQLQDIIKIAKEYARKTYDMYLPNSLRPKFSRTNIQDFIGSLLEIYQELLNAGVDSKCLLKHQFQVVGDEIRSLNDAFNKFTAKCPSHHGELRIQSAHFSDIEFLIRYTITSYFYRKGTLWIHKLGLFNVIGEIRMIKIELKDLQNKMTHDTSVNAEENKTTTDNAVIFDDEAEIGEQQTNGLQILSIEEMPKIEDQLRWLETNVDLIDPLKDEAQTLLLKSSFLKIFLSFKGKRNIGDRNLQALLISIQTTFKNADQDLHRLFIELPKNMDGLLCSVLERFHLLKPDIQQVYTILSKSSRSITDMNSEAIMENLNFLLEKSEDLLRCNAVFIAPIQEELQAVQKSLGFLRNFIGFTAKTCSKLEDFKDLLIHTEFLADNISCLLYLCSFNDMMNDQTVNKMKEQLLSELQKFSPAQPDVGKIYIKSLKSSKSAERNSNFVDKFDLGFLRSLRDHILEFSDTKHSFITSNREQILSLIEELRFVTTFFAVDKSLEEHFYQKSNNLLDRIIFLIIDTGCVINALHNLDQDGDKSSDMKIAVSDLQDMVKIAKEDARKVYGIYHPKSLWSIYPTTNGQCFIGFLFRNLKELQNTKLKLTGSLFQNADQILVAPFKHHIEVALHELQSLREGFSKFAEHPSQFEELPGQWTRFIGIAYQTECVIDSFLGGGTGPLCHHKLELFDVIEEIKTIKMELEAIKNKTKDKNSVQQPSCFHSQTSLEANGPKNNAMPRFEERMADEQTVSKLVIFGEAEEIKEKLTNGSQKLNFLSIVGMPGIGKTTLADSVFQHFSSSRHFHVLARCSVSQVHDKWRMLREILQQVTDERKQYRDDDLEQKLKQSLFGRRYLIFLDDMWDIRPWEDIKACFPDDENGSRIMFTSRSDGIASQAGLESTAYRLLPLSEDKSWEMLRVKVFGSESCPPELLSVGREIAANCKGLPLTIDLIAGILRATTKRENWKEVVDSMMPRLFNDPLGRCWNVLELSYKDLPDELKPCFLYFAAFPEDADVPAMKLFSLWIAEGFVQLQEDDLRSLEDAAEDILNDLISRSLVTVSRNRLLGGVKGTRVHDLLHEFALAKAREESFMMIINGKAEKAQWQEQYRLYISDPRVEFHESSRARAVICSEEALNFSVFKLLRVLDIPKGCPALFTLIHLRFLAIRRSACRILPEIHKLQNLQTFILEEYYGNDEYLLMDKVCNMVRLRHFKVGGYFSFRYKTQKILDKFSLFDNLRTLCGLQLSYAEEIEKILKLMPNLVKLKVKFYNSDGECYPFPKLNFFKKLESLEVKHDNSQNPCKITSFPPCLKKLVLSSFRVPWTEIQEMGNFEYLEVLKLKSEAFEGPRWDMVDGQFPKLKCLSLDDLDIKVWNSSEDGLSCLEQLHLERCGKLKVLPSCLAESAALQVIKLSFCRARAEDSVQRIKEEQHENGNEISVVISHV